MWFAALGSYQQAPWFVSFLVRLMDNSRPVIALLANDPFPSAPPAYVRGSVRNYHFSKPTNGSLISEMRAEIDRLHTQGLFAYVSHVCVCGGACAAARMVFAGRLGGGGGGPTERQ